MAQTAESNIIHSLDESSFENIAFDLKNFDLSSFRASSSIASRFLISSFSRINGSPTLNAETMAII